MTDKKQKIEKKVIGWREKASLPGIGVSSVKVKVDSGARTSALHATHIEFIKVKNKKRVRFRVHPKEGHKAWITAEADFVEKRTITSSTGRQTVRPVIKTKIKLAGEEWLIELTLVNREMMGFRMLLGREAFRRKFLVDASRSYIGKKNVKK